MDERVRTRTYAPECRLYDRFEMHTRSEDAMQQINVYLTGYGWFWEVRIDRRIVAFGWSDTRERAERNARLA